MFSIRLARTFAHRPATVRRPRRMTIKADAGVVIVSTNKQIM